MENFEPEKYLIPNEVVSQFIEIIKDWKLIFEDNLPIYNFIT